MVFSLPHEGRPRARPGGLRRLAHRRRQHRRRGHLPRQRRRGAARPLAGGVPRDVAARGRRRARGGAQQRRARRALPALGRRVRLPARGVRAVARLPQRLDELLDRVPRLDRLARRRARRDARAACSGLGSSFAPKAIGDAAIVALTVVNALRPPPGQVDAERALGRQARRLRGPAGARARSFRTQRASGLTPFFVPGDRAGGHRDGAHPRALRVQRLERRHLRRGRDARPDAVARAARSRSARGCASRSTSPSTPSTCARCRWPTSRRRRSRRAPRRSLLGGDAARRVLSPLVAVCVLSSMQASVLVGPRIYHAMASDGLFFAPARQARTTDAGARRGARRRRASSRSRCSSAGASTSSCASRCRRSSPSRRSPWRRSSCCGVAAPGRAARVPRPGLPAGCRALFIAVNVWMLWSVLTFGESSPREALLGLAIVATGVPGVRCLPGARSGRRSVLNRRARRSVV